MAVYTHISHWRLQDTTYHYRCPGCRRWLDCAWSARQDPRICPYESCALRHVATAPMFDPLAWVEMRDAPYEMARAAFLLHGRVVNGRHMCSVPHCEREATVLDHRVPFDPRAQPEDNPGKTCVENLYPMCSECDRSKDEDGYEEWSTSPDLRVLNEE